MKMWSISPLHLPAELGQGLLSSRMEENLASFWGYSNLWGAGGTAGKAHLPGGKRQQVSHPSSTGSFSLLKP